ALRLARRSDRLDRPSGAALLPISRTPGAVGPGRLSRPRRAGAALLRLGGKARGLGRLDGSASRRGGRARGFFPRGGASPVGIACRGSSGGGLRPGPLREEEGANRGGARPLRPDPRA